MNNKLKNVILFSALSITSLWLTQANYNPVNTTSTCKTTCLKNSETCKMVCKVVKEKITNNWKQIITSTTTKKIPNTNNTTNNTITETTAGNTNNTTTTDNTNNTNNTTNNTITNTIKNNFLLVFFCIIFVIATILQRIFN